MITRSRSLLGRPHRRTRTGGTRVLALGVVIAGSTLLGGCGSAAPAAALEVMVDDLAWWGNLLARARADGELAHPFVRLGEAVARRSPPT